jgi:polysaccharide lyase-like protein
VDLGGGVFFADTFESGLNPAWTQSNNGGGSIAIDTSGGANASAASVRIVSGGFHIMLQYALPDAVRTNNSFYGRAFVRVEADPGGNHIVWIEAGTAMNDSHEMRIGYNLGLLQVNHFGGPNGGDQDIRDRNRQLTPNTWHCVQFFMNGNPEELQVWLDGTETALSTDNFTAQGEGAEGNTTPLNDWMPAFEVVRFGWELNGGGKAISFDNVALGNEFIECDQ